MPKLFSHFKKLRHLVIGAFRNRLVYSSPWEAVKAFRLKLAATTPGKRLFPEQVCTVMFNQLGEPIHVRQTSSDIQVAEEIFERGAYEPARQWSLPRGANILDLGGNIGLATLY